MAVSNGVVGSSVIADATRITLGYSMLVGSSTIITTDHSTIIYLTTGTELIADATQNTGVSISLVTAQQYTPYISVIKIRD
jgi:hypothetical protein